MVPWVAVILRLNKDFTFVRSMVKCNQVLELKVAQNFQKSPNLSDCRGSQKVGGNDALMFSSLGVNFKKSRNPTPIKLFQFGLKRLFPSLVSRNFC